MQSVKHQRGGEDLGYKIKALREERGMTQEALAVNSGVSRGTICALESGTEYTTTTKTLLKIAKALGVTVDALFFEDSV